MIVFFYDNNQIVCILLLWMLLGGIGVPMATVSAQDVSTDSTGRAVKLNQVVISKRDMRMIVLRPTGDTLAVFRIACGRNYGHKQREWDCRTPEGRFVIASVEDPSVWQKDMAKTESPGEVYGPRFFRLKTPGFTGIGIHGTSKPELIPGRITMGCIRLSNKDLYVFAKLVGVDTEVSILPDKNDTINDLLTNY